MAKTDKNEVAVVKSAEVAAIPDYLLGDLGQFSGFEGADKDAYAIPFISILQKMSPQVDEDDPKHIEGAKAGSFLNSVTGQLFDGKEGMFFIPAAFKRSYIQWGGRESDEKGFKGEFTPEQVEALIAEGKIIEQDGKLFKPNEDGTINDKKNDRYEDTRAHYIVVVNPETGEFGRAILSLSSSQIKASKMLMTSLSQKKIKTAKGMLTPPTFANLVKATTTGMSNDKGTWSGAKFDLVELVSNVDLFNEAKDFAASILKGEISADYTKAPTQDGEVDGAPKSADQF